MFTSASSKEFGFVREPLSCTGQLQIKQHAFSRNTRVTPASQPTTLRLSRLLEWRTRRKVSTHSLRGAGALQVRAVAGEVVDVEELEGVRVILQSNRPVAQFLVKWKDGKPSTW